MRDIKITADLSKYEPKFIGPFSFRQTVLSAFSVVAFIFLKNTIGKILGEAAIFPLAVIASAPAVLFGWIKPYDMHFEQFLKAAFISNVLSPKVRKYKTKNVFESLYEEVNKEEKKLAKEMNSNKKKGIFAFLKK